MGHNAPLDYRAVFPFQGIPLEIRSNSPAVIKAADKYFGIWSKLDREVIASIAPKPISIIVHPGAQQEKQQAQFVYRVHGDHLLGASGSNILMVQKDCGIALAFVTAEIVEDDIEFQVHILGTIALQLVMMLDRSFIHAGTVVYNDRPIMLLGKGGAGKSTLCYACVREGFQLLAEDASFVSIKNSVRVWNSSKYIHLCTDMAKRFSELAEIPPQIQPNGEIKIAIDVTKLRSDALCLYAENPMICVLERNGCMTSDLEAISAQTLMNYLGKDAEPGYDMNMDHQKMARILSNGEKYQLTIGENIDSAVTLLKKLASSRKFRNL